MDQEVNTPNSALAELRQAGEHPAQELLERVKDMGAAVVQPLIAMATDRDLHDAGEASPEVWAPLHAITILGEMNAAEAVEPLLPLLDWEGDEWLSGTLPLFFGRVGEPALGPLRTYLFDRAHTIHARATAASALAEIAKQHSALRPDAIAALSARLDPVLSQTPDDETLNGFVIGALLDLKAVESLPAIQRAFEEDHVDQTIVDLPWVECELGLRDEEPQPNRPQGLRLRLRCTACGYERKHDVAKIYCDRATQEQRQSGKETPYSEWIIPQRITCPKCGAMDQYELTSEAYLSLMANTLALTPEFRKLRASPGVEEEDEEGSPILYRRFTVAGGREMHPQAAIEMYRRQIAEEPERADLRVRYGHVLDFLGYKDEATREYRAAIEQDPTNLEAHVNLAVLSRDAGDRHEARRLFQRVIALAPRSHLPRDQREDFLSFAREEVYEIDHPRISTARRTDRDLVHLSTQPGAAPTPARARLALPGGKIGRNDPCPCGSGQKFKKCCGR